MIFTLCVSAIGCSRSPVTIQVPCCAFLFISSTSSVNRSRHHCLMGSCSTRRTPSTRKVNNSGPSFTYTPCPERIFQPVPSAWRNKGGDPIWFLKLTTADTLGTACAHSAIWLQKWSCLAASLSSSLGLLGFGLSPKTESIPPVKKVLIVPLFPISRVQGQGNSLPRFPSSAVSTGPCPNKLPSASRSIIQRTAFGANATSARRFLDCA